MPETDHVPPLTRRQRLLIGAVLVGAAVFGFFSVPLGIFWT